MMLTHATVSNYKGIKQCEIKDLGRVNLFIGKNDSGKSSILEAIFYTGKEFVKPTLDEIMARRTNVFTGGRELWYRYDTKPKIRVNLSFKDVDIEMQARMEGSQINTILSLSRGERKWEIHGPSYIGKDFTISIGREKILTQFKEKLPSQMYKEVARYVENTDFIDCRSKTNLSDMESELGQIKLDGKDEEFGSIIENVYGKGKAWEFLPHPDNPEEKRIAFKEGRKPIFLSDFGDGLRFGLAICATATNLEGTSIFIEEIENHQHPGSLRNLLGTLMDIAFENDLQLFITTHSRLVLRFVWYHFRPTESKVDKRASNVTFFHVMRESETGQVECKPIDIQNAVELDQLTSDIFELTETR